MKNILGDFTKSSDDDCSDHQILRSGEEVFLNNLGEIKNVHSTFQHAFRDFHAAILVPRNINPKTSFFR